jgi:hypothetical protein
MLEVEPDRREVMRLAIANGSTYKAIGSRLGVSRQRVGQLVRYYGLPSPAAVRRMVSFRKRRERGLRAERDNAMWESHGRYMASAWARLWINVRVAGPSECWPWMGSIHEGGYGTFYIGRLYCSAHRLMMEYVTGRTPTLYVLHSCDNRRCVNPAHLREGTHEENMADRVARRRTASGPRQSEAIRTGWALRRVS